MTDKVQKSDAEWQKQLDPLQHHVLRCHGTERPGSSPLNKEYRPGHFVCAGCGQPVFETTTKFDSGTGWPSFYQAKPGAVDTTRDTSHGMTRTEFHCAQCGGEVAPPGRNA